jgi:hypothetical protein
VVVAVVEVVAVAVHPTLAHGITERIMEVEVVATMTIVVVVAVVALVELVRVAIMPVVMAMPTIVHGR